MKNETTKTTVQIILFASFLAVTAFCFFGVIKASETKAEKFEQCIQIKAETNCERYLR